MIIFGTRGVTTTPQNGSFFCPECQSETNYGLKRVRRFFTLYFIPIIPMDMLGEYVECQRCAGTFKPEILTWDPQQQALEMDAIFHGATKQVMIAMLLADGVIDDEEVVAIQEIYRELTGHEIDEASLRQEIAEMQQQDQDVIQVVESLAGMLNDNGKETVMRAAYRVAAADGVFDPEEQALLLQIGKGLGMSDAHMHGVLAQFTAADPPPLPASQS